MSGDNHYQPGPGLPAPQHESANSPIPAANPEAKQGEQASRQPELPPMPAPTPPASASPSQPQTPFVPPPLPSFPTAQPAKPAPSGATPIPVTAVPDSADDSDLIEKEWVYKAKHIVETSRDDPREQNKEISKLKADYIQKRYNKQLKISED